MKKKLIALGTTIGILTTGLFVAYAMEPLYSSVPRVINYDGTLEQNGVSANGMHNFQFRLVDGAGNVMWPDNGYADRDIDVVNGKFSVQFPESGEEILGDEVFNTRPLNLRIFVKSAADAVSHQLSPDVRINAVPFAVKAERAIEVDTVPTGMVSPYYGLTTPYGWLIADGSVVDYREAGSCTGDICGAHLTELVAHLRAVNVVQNQEVKNPAEAQQAVLPDMRGMFLRSRDDGAGVNPDAEGDEIGKVQGDAFGSHDHGGGDHSHTGTTSGGKIPAQPAEEHSGIVNQGYTVPGWMYYTWQQNSSNRSLAIDTSGNVLSSAGDNETRPINMTVVHIIKW